MPRPTVFAVYSPVKGRSELVFDKEVATIGRDESCDLRLDSMTVEREHARLIRHDDEVLLEDLGSKTGVKVNGARVTRHKLAQGDEIEICNFFIKLEGPAPANPSSKPERLRFVSRLGRETSDGPPSRTPTRPRPQAAPPPSPDVAGLEPMRNVMIGDHESNLIIPAVDLSEEPGYPAAPQAPRPIADLGGEEDVSLGSRKGPALDIVIGSDAEVAPSLPFRSGLDALASTVPVRRGAGAAGAGGASEGARSPGPAKPGNAAKPAEPGRTASDRAWNTALARLASDRTGADSRDNTGEQTLDPGRPPPFGPGNREPQGDDLEARARAIHARNQAMSPGAGDARALSRHGGDTPHPGHGGDTPHPGHGGDTPHPGQAPGAAPRGPVIPADPPPVPEAPAPAVVGLFEDQAAPAGLAEPRWVRGAASRSLLEWMEVDDSALRIGGMDAIKRWISQRRGAFGPAAKEFGIEPPRGALLLGLPGCGKRLAARAAAFLWERKLARLDLEELATRDPREWAGALDAALDEAERAAPCVLLVPELDRFARQATAGSAAARVMGRLVTWLRRSRTVAAMITAVELAALPEELKRRGELLDEVFLLDLPTARERWQIWPFALQRKGRTAAGYDGAALVRGSEGRTGAELARAVEDALHEAFQEGRQLTTGDLLRALDAAPPIARAMEIQLAALREEGPRWAMVASEERPPGLAAVHDLGSRGGGGGDRST